MIGSARASVAFVAVALFGISTTPACSSDSGGTEASSAGAAGTAVASGGASNGVAGGPAAGASFGGAGSGGFVSAGAGGSAAGAGGSAAGAGAGGSAAGAGAGGTAAGAGGTAAGAGGTAAGSAGSGGVVVSFTAVKAIFTSSCGNGCHNAASGELNFQSSTLRSVLTSPIPAGTANCVGTTPVVANSQSSYLLAVLKGATTCPVGKGKIDLMPLGCSTDAGSGRPCLTAAQIKTISDWIAAGAPAN